MLSKKEYDKQRYINNKEQIKELSKQYYRNNKEKVSIKCRKYEKSHPGKCALYRLKTQTNRSLRIPRWLSQEELKQIELFYDNCPEGYEVDHIIPLQGKLVSGLHRINNLQYLSKLENRKKYNNFLMEV